MIKLKKLKLVNFCGYRDVEIDLSDKNEVLKWAMLFSPNGSGKSNFLNAVQLLSNPWRFESRPTTNMFFRKLTYHPDYIPNYEGFDESKTELYMEALFETEEGDKRVIMQNTWNEKTSGVVLNELPRRIFSACYYVDADNAINTQKFQIYSEHTEEFLEFAEAVYDFKCELPVDRIVNVYDPQTDKYINFNTDLVITKYGDTRVHFKRMSAGEKKIATMLCQLFNNIYGVRSRGENIILIDNITMHIYWKRHMKILELIDKYFPDQQIIATTHSPIIINNMNKKYLIDLEQILNNFHKKNKIEDKEI
ncbi:MAG: AAA family ATPase [Clostridiales bacterium]|nr:AAA family ATPase [Clostridiales bacterium]